MSPGSARLPPLPRCRANGARLGCPSRQPTHSAKRWPLSAAGLRRRPAATTRLAAAAAGQRRSEKLAERNATPSGQPPVTPPFARTPAVLCVYFSSSARPSRTAALLSSLPVSYRLHGRRDSKIATPPPLLQQSNRPRPCLATPALPPLQPLPPSHLPHFDRQPAPVRTWGVSSAPGGWPDSGLINKRFGGWPCESDKIQ
jgi:hypothetical protein